MVNTNISRLSTAPHLRKLTSSQTISYVNIILFSSWSSSSAAPNIPLTSFLFFLSTRDVNNTIKILELKSFLLQTLLSPIKIQVNPIFRFSSLLLRQHWTLYIKCPCRQLHKPYKHLGSVQSASCSGGLTVIIIRVSCCYYCCWWCRRAYHISLLHVLPVSRFSPLVEPRERKWREPEEGERNHDLRSTLWQDCCALLFKEKLQWECMHAINETGALLPSFVVSCILPCFFVMACPCTSFRFFLPWLRVLKNLIL